MKVLYGFAYISLNIVLRAFFRMKVYGRANLPGGPAILAANHQSYIDPTAIGASMLEEMYYLAREDFFEWRPFLWLCRKLNSIMIQKRRADRSALNAVLAKLAEGWKVLVFPEGTRSHDGRLQPPQRGISLLAHKSGVPVVPTYVSGTHRVLPRGRTMIHFHPISVSFGEPFRFDTALLDQGAHAAYEAFSHRVMEAIARLKADRERRPPP
jgi:1-acyl-sn-glycerol-3-phosphate acyltransferase